MYNLNDIMQSQNFEKDAKILRSELLYIRSPCEANHLPKWVKAKKQFASCLAGLEAANKQADAMWQVRPQGDRDAAQERVIQLAAKLARSLDQMHNALASNAEFKDFLVPVTQKISDMLAKHKPFIEKIDSQFKDSEVSFQSKCKERMVFFQMTVFLGVALDILLYPNLLPEKIEAAVAAAALPAGAALIIETKQRRISSASLEDLNKRLTEKGIRLKVNEITPRNPPDVSR